MAPYLRDLLYKERISRLKLTTLEKGRERGDDRNTRKHENKLQWTT